MFYSTEILSSKNSALSTVWRAGNTAPGAMNTGIRRKAVLEVNIERACGTIIDPPGAPIALRLQGTLLYGTARIFQEKCRYVLTDSERIQRTMFKLCSSLLDDKIDRNAGRVKSVQIALPDDPGFDLDFLQLPAFDFNAAEGASLISQSRQNSWSNMSAPSRQSNSQLPQIVLDADSSGHRSYVGGFPFSGSGASIMQESPTPFGRPLPPVDDEENLLGDVGLFIDENGNIVEEELRPEPQLPNIPSQARKKNAQGDAAAVEVEGGPMIVSEDGQIVPPGAHLAAHGPKLAAAEKTWQPQASSSSSQTQSSPQTASSRIARHRAQRAPKFVDEITQIPLNEYFNCVSNYARNMQRESDRKDRSRSNRLANDQSRNKQTAYNFTIGRGLFSIAKQLDQRNPEHPLVQMFSGDALGQTLFENELEKAKRRKTADADPSTPVRGRGGLGGERIGMADEDQEIEQGRQPASALSDNPSLQLHRHSSLAPGSSAHGSFQRSAGLGRQVPVGGLASAERRQDPSFIERYSDDGMDLGAQFFNHAKSSSVGRVMPLGHPIPASDGMANKETHAAANDGGEEMRNASVLLGLVREKAAVNGLWRPDLSEHHLWVSFDEMVEPVKRSRPTVVGAFMNLLSLATSRQLRLQQDGADNWSLDKQIMIGVTEAVKAEKTKKRSFEQMNRESNDLACQEDLMIGHVFPDAMEMDGELEAVNNEET